MGQGSILPALVMMPSAILSVVQAPQLHNRGRVRPHIFAPRSKTSTIEDFDARSEFQIKPGAVQEDCDAEHYSKARS